MFWVSFIVLVAIVIVKISGCPKNMVGIGGSGINRSKVETSPIKGEDVEERREQRKKELEKLEIAKKKLLVDAERRVKKYQGDVKAITERYKKMLPLSDAEYFLKESENGVAFISSRDGLCGFGSCVVLAYKMAYDKIKGTKKVEDAISPIVQTNIVDYIERAFDVYAKWTGDFQKEMITEERALAADLALACNGFENEVLILSSNSVQNIGKAIEKFKEDIQEHAFEAVISTVGLATEMVVIKTSYATIKKVVIQLSRIALDSAVKKIGTTAATGAAVAVADGPLPFGDIVTTILTIGGLSWTAYDIYKVTKTMPEEMEQKLKSTIAETRAALISAAKNNLQKACEESCSSAENKMIEIKKILEN
jgi:hypothetical protein